MEDSPDEAPGRARGLFLAAGLPPVLWLAVLFFAPLAIVWGYSFGERDGLVDIDVTWTLDNYVQALDPIYARVFLRSLWFAALATAICLAVGFPVAMAVAFAPPRRQPLLLLLVVLPFWTNLLIRTFALHRVLGRNGLVNWIWEAIHGRVDGALRAVGLPGLAPFEPLDLLYNDFAVIFGLVYVALPFMVLPLYSALERLDRSHIEASLDLGAGRLRAFSSVVAPLAWSGVVSGLIITFIPTLGSFLTPDLLGGPDSQMIANIVARQFSEANNWPFGAALSYVLVYATFILLALQAALSARRRARAAAASEAAGA